MTLKPYIANENLSLKFQGGMYIFQIFDYYSQARIVLVIGIFECIAVAWVYGKYK